MDQLLKTPLYDIYEQYDAKIVDFAGWAMPIFYEGIIPEHHSVRNFAGIFDVSHMGEISVEGEESTNFLNNILSNDITHIKDNQVQYSLLLNESGGIIDDILVYKFSDEHFMLVANAANKSKDLDWINKQSTGYKVSIEDISDRIAQLAIQGPIAKEILQLSTDYILNNIRFFRFNSSVNIAGINCLVSRTGYTGEDGFELYFDSNSAIELWQKLLDTGKSYGLKPAGLGCRDTLRFEACLTLYGNEISETITPYESGLDNFVKLEKNNFIGKDALLEQLEHGIERRLIGFEMIDRGVPRSDYKVLKNGKEIGYVTTGYFSPTLKKNLGLALIDSNVATPGVEIGVLIRGKVLKARTREIPFYKKRYQK